MGRSTGLTFPQITSILIVVLSILGGKIWHSFLNIHPDTGLNVLELAIKHGYPIERHQNIETEDGYILEMHRITKPIQNDTLINKTVTKPVVLFMHGIMSTSADWLPLGPGKALPYILTDLNYDVWLANARGNTWSRKHKTLHPDRDNKKFSDYSFHEIGVYDLPAKIDYILANTGAEKIFIVAHSQGCTSFFAMASDKPEYNDKIRLMTALSPVAYADNIPQYIFHITKLIGGTIEDVSNFLDLHEFNYVKLGPTLTYLSKLMFHSICIDGSPFQFICLSSLFTITGYDFHQFNSTLIPVIFTNFPDIASVKQALHYNQAIATGTFRQYDYDDYVINFQRYGQVSPPVYSIKNITAPIALHYGQNDWFASIKDVKRLEAELPNVVLSRMIEYSNFNHGDFLFAKNVLELLYNDVINTMQKY